MDSVGGVSKDKFQTNEITNPGNPRWSRPSRRFTTFTRVASHSFLPRSLTQAT